MKLSKSEIEQMYPYDDLYATWVKSPENATLPDAEKAERWEQQRAGIDALFGLLDGKEAFVVEEENDLEEVGQWVAREGFEGKAADGEEETR